MPYDRRHVVIQWGGTLPGGEIWSNMLRAGGPFTGPTAGVPTHEELEELVHGELKDEVLQFHQRAATRIHVGCKLTYLKANVVDMDGHYTDPNTIEHVYSPPAAGGSSLVYHPPQVAWVVSLTTDLGRGLAHQGRFYLPAPSVEVMASDSMVVAADANALAGSVKTFIEAVADTPGWDFADPFQVLVMSKGGTGGATHLVTGVRVGRVLDTQQRRRRDLAENYVTSPIDQGSS